MVRQKPGYAHSNHDDASVWDGHRWPIVPLEGPDIMEAGGQILDATQREILSRNGDGSPSSLTLVNGLSSSVIRSSLEDV